MRINNINTTLILQTLGLTIVLLFSSLSINAQEFDKVADLSGKWKFSIGDNPTWAKPDYDDSHWEEIRVPRSWEDQGFHGYDGYAWYRTKVKTPRNANHSSLYLKLGYIDDVDMVFINGKKIGQTGQFPPHYTTAYNANRIYVIPHKLIANDEYLNIAIRVFDEGGEGGIIHGDISILIDKSSIVTDVNLQGEWKFKTGNCSGDPSKMDYKNWDEIIVPGTWEDQGYKNYDGVACYVNEFELDGEFEDQRVVLVLGRIDDLDMVYLNGTLIGQSGEFAKSTVDARKDMYKVQRTYFIPQNILKDNGKNVLAVKVFDSFGSGGIYDGSIGLISQDKFIQYWRNKRNSIN